MGFGGMPCRWASAFATLTLLIVQIRAVGGQQTSLENCSDFPNDQERSFLNVTMEIRSRDVDSLAAFEQGLSVDGGSLSSWLNETVQDVCLVARVRGCLPVMISFQSYPHLNALVEVGSMEAECGKRNVNKYIFTTALEGRLNDVRAPNYQPTSQFLRILSAEASVIKMSVMELFEYYITSAATPNPEPPVDSRLVVFQAALGAAACLLVLVVIAMVALYYCGCLKFSQSRSDKFVTMPEVSSFVTTTHSGINRPHSTNTVNGLADVMNGKYRIEGSTMIRVDNDSSGFGHGVFGYMQTITGERGGAMPQVSEDSDLKSAVSKLSQSDMMNSVHGMMPTGPMQALHGASFVSRNSSTLAMAESAPHGSGLISRSKHLLSGTYHVGMPHGVGVPSGPSKKIGTFMRLISRLKVDFESLTFDKEIGRGSCKTVYHGRWCSTEVAIVRMKKGGMATEARIMQKLGTHPNLVQFYRWTRDCHGNEYMIMELVPRGSLDKLLYTKSAAYDFTAKLMTCEQICDAMRELAREGLLHCDLAARNVLVASVSPIHVKVADFGMAREWEFQGADNGDENKKMLDCIPLRWTAPEVFRSGFWSEKSDVWAFGVTMWEIFADGEVPFVRDLGDPSNEAIINHVLSGNYLEKPAGCPSAVYSIMQTCWAYNMEDRPTFDMLQQRFHHVRSQIRNFPRQLAPPPASHLEARRTDQMNDNRGTSSAARWDEELGYRGEGGSPISTLKCHGRIHMNNDRCPPGVVHAWEHDTATGDNIVLDNFGHGVMPTAGSCKFDDQMSIPSGCDSIFPQYDGTPPGHISTPSSAPNHTGYVSMPALTCSHQEPPGSFSSPGNNIITTGSPGIELQQAAPSPYASVHTMLREAHENAACKPLGD